MAEQREEEVDQREDGVAVGGRAMVGIAVEVAGYEGDDGDEGECGEEDADEGGEVDGEGVDGGKVDAGAGRGRPRRALWEGNVGGHGGYGG